MSAGSTSHSRAYWAAGACAVLVIALLGWWLLGSRSAASQKRGPMPVSVQVASVQTRDVPQLLTAVGTVQALNSVVLKPQIDGVLTQVLVKEGQRVTQGETLALIDDRAIVANLEQAQAERNRNNANLKVTQLDLQRDENLLAEEAISRQTVEQQRAMVEQLQATLQSNEAAIKAVEIQRSYTRIVSPLNGRVGFRRVDPGNLVHATDADGLFSVVQLDPISVVFSLPQQELSRLQPLVADPSQGEVTVFDRDSGHALTHGRLMTLDDQVDAATGTLRLRAQFANSNGLLWPGQFVTVQLRTNVDAGATVVDTRAIRRGISGAYVFRVLQGVAEVVPVTERYEQDTLTAVSAGLKAGDVVVVDGQSQLIAGTPVHVVSDEAGTAAVSGGVAIAQ